MTTQRGLARRDGRTQEMTTFPEKDGGSFLVLSPEAKQALIGWSKERGLDVYAGHTMLLWGKPYVTIDGLAAWVRNKYPKQYSGYSNRALTRSEREGSGFKDGDVVVECTLLARHDDGTQYAVTDAAAVTKVEQDLAIQQIEDKMATETIWKEQNGRRVNTGQPKWDKKAREKEWDREFNRRCMTMPILKNPRGMAGKRALAMLIKRTFPVEAELGVQEFAEEKTLQHQAPPQSVPPGVDPATGEVTEGDFTDITDEMMDGQRQSPQDGRSASGPVSESGNGASRPTAATAASAEAPAKPAPRTFKSHAEFREACKGLGLDEKGIAERLGGPLEGFRVSDLTGAWVRVQAGRSA